MNPRINLRVTEEKPYLENMNKILIMVSVLVFVAACAVPQGQIKKKTAPGQIQKDTGYNPASGKIKSKQK